MILDLFAGPGGWSEGLRTLGLTDVGIEWDAAACATRAAAGHTTIRADIAQYPTAPFVGKITGLIASPPCQDFSLAGKRAGVDGERGQLVTEVMRWADALRPEWIACEQVPPVLPIWHDYARRLEALGYSTWAGILNSADYGVPQTRRRAILMASRVRPVQPPEPTHAKNPEPGLFGTLEPWVTMADALGWASGRVGFARLDDKGTSPDGYRERDWRTTDQPAFVLTEKARSWTIEGLTLGDRYQPNSAIRSALEPAPTILASADNGNTQWVWRQPATTVAGDPRITARCHHDEGSQGANAKSTDEVRGGDYDGTAPIKLTVAEALVLQSFPADYPVAGTKTKQFEQIGNAIPPVLAAHIIGALT